MKRGTAILIAVILSIMAIQAAGQEKMASRLEYCGCPYLPSVYMVAKISDSEELVLQLLGEGAGSSNVKPVAIRDIKTSRHWLVKETDKKPYYEKGRDLGVMKTCVFIDTYIRSPKEKEVFKYPC